MTRPKFSTFLLINAKYVPLIIVAMDLLLCFVGPNKSTYRPFKYFNVIKLILAVVNDKVQVFCFMSWLILHKVTYFRNTSVMFVPLGFIVMGLLKYTVKMPLV